MKSQIIKHLNPTGCFLAERKASDKRNLQYSVKDIEALLSINPQTLRSWEKRYNLVQPKRNPLNERVYDQDDFELLRDICILKENGWKISTLMDKTAAERHELTQSLQTASGAIDNVLDSWVDDIIRLDADSFERRYDQLQQLIPTRFIIRDFILPVIDRLQILWLTGSVGVMHERFLGQLIKRKMIVLIDHLQANLPASSRRVILFSPEFDLKNYLLYILHYLLLLGGFRPINFGMNVEPEELSPLIQQWPDASVLTYLTNDHEPSDLQNKILTLENTFHPLPVTIIIHPPLRQNFKITGSPRIFHGILAFMEKHF